MGVIRVTLVKFLKRTKALELIDSLKTSEGEKKYLKFLLDMWLNDPNTKNRDMLKGRLIRTTYENRRNLKTVIKILDLLGIP